MKIKKFSNTHFVVALILLYIVALSVLSKNTPHFPFGDGLEYVMMTESFYNHFSPDLQKSDIENYLEYLNKRGLTVHKVGKLEPNLERTADQGLSLDGYYHTESGTYYSYHFWFYSLVNVPARAVLEHLRADIRLTFLATNLFLFFLGIWLISRLKELKVGHRVVLSLVLILSPAMWYIDWAHAEVWGGVLSFLASLFYFVKRKYLSLFFFSLAAVHYPPLFIPALFVFVDILYRSGFKVQVLLKLFFASFWIILPPLFYLIHYGTPSLIANSGILSFDVVDLKRLSSFFFDLNQGMIIGIPLILISVIIFLVRDLVRKKLYAMYLFLAFILLMSLFFMQMTNWNHGNAVVNRYVVWTAAIVIVVFYSRIAQLKRIWFYCISGLVIVSQGFVIFSQQDFNKIVWHANNFNKLSQTIMNRYPSLYNPDPTVFKERINPYTLSSTDSVYVYTNDEEEIIKMLIKEGAISQLVKRGVDSQKVKELEEDLNYYHGYAYVNKSDLEEIGYNQAEDAYIDTIEQAKEFKLKDDLRRTILNSPGWYKGIEEQAAGMKIPVDSAIELNVQYIYEQGMKSR